MSSQQLITLDQVVRLTHWLTSIIPLVSPHILNIVVCTDMYVIAGDNSDKLCEICTGAVPGGKCTSADPYAGFEGAFRCLVEAGDIAFLKHTTVQEMTALGLQLCKFYWKINK